MSSTTKADLAKEYEEQMKKLQAEYAAKLAAAQPDDKPPKKAPAKKKAAAQPASTDSTNEAVPESPTKRKPEEEAEAPAPKRKAPAKKKEVIDIPFEETAMSIATGTKDTLAGLCKKYGLKVTGKREELQDRLREYMRTHPNPNQPADEAGPSNPGDSDKKAIFASFLGGLGGKPAPKKAAKSAPLVLKKLRANVPRHNIARNRFGNYEHAESKLVFDRDDQCVIGKQDYGSGNIIDLTDEDIETCKQYQFNYRLPENLDANKKGMKVKVDDVEEEVDEEDLAADDAFEDDDDGGEEDPFVDDE